MPLITDEQYAEYKNLLELQREHERVRIEWVSRANHHEDERIKDEYLSPRSFFALCNFIGIREGNIVDDTHSTIPGVGFFSVIDKAIMPAKLWDSLESELISRLEFEDRQKFYDWLSNLEGWEKAYEYSYVYPPASEGDHFMNLINIEQEKV